MNVPMLDTLPILTHKHDYKYMSVPTLVTSAHETKTLKRSAFVGTTRFIYWCLTLTTLSKQTTHQTAPKHAKYFHGHNLASRKYIKSYSIRVEADTSYHNKN